MCSSRHPIMSLPGHKHLTVFDCSCVVICHKCICTWRLRDWVVEIWICKSILYNCFTYCTNCLWWAHIRSSVLIKSALHRLITGMCEGSISFFSFFLILSFSELKVNFPNVLLWCCFKWVFSLLQTHSHTYCVFSSLLGNYCVKCLYISVYPLPQLCKNVTFWFDVS